MPRNDELPPAAQLGFGSALLNSDLPVPEGVIGPRGKSATKRFAVYRNNMTVSLIEALASIFPAVERLVGEDFFRDMARVYLLEEPPRTPLMFEYGGGFAAFLEGFEPVAKLVYLPDVARLERAWLDAFHAADASPLPPGALGAIPPECLGDVVFTPHPATRLVQSRYASVSIFSASREERPLDAIRPLDPEDGLITRPHYDVQVRQLPPGAAVFFKALMAGTSLGDAAGLTLEQHPGFDLPSAISAMLEAGVFSACSPGRAHSEHSA
ncbi:DNA-binding domain-containing protein [Hoeflea ulvae]|uniref:DNA-binding domain-containing protein n=1 Tax=Hoeflea ulvae TaxID=2983764 RepID=A0ABT3YLB9_9HYPH|nr:DNA-binding domain-containing protein [Hoeflea ulvae]MCY0096569.1 DNA-binding domain-containing protein [Hoeflea ulvae]